MLEIKRTNSEKNYVLTNIVKELRTRDAKINIKYNSKDHVGVKLRECDYEDFSIFLLGMFKEAYEASDKSKMFKLAIKEILSGYLEDVECKK